MAFYKDFFIDMAVEDIHSEFLFVSPLTLKDRAPIRTLSDRGEGGF